MSIGVNSVAAILVVLGFFLLLIGMFGGGVEVKEFKVPQAGAPARLLSAAVGVLMMLIGIGIEAQKNESAHPTPSPQTASINPAPNAPSNPSAPRFNPPPRFNPQPTQQVAYEVHDTVWSEWLNETVEIFIDGKFVGRIFASTIMPKASIKLTAPRPGTYSYRLVVRGNSFVKDGKGKSVFKTSIATGNGFIEIKSGSVFEVRFTEIAGQNNLSRVMLVKKY